MIRRTAAVLLGLSLLGAPLSASAVDPSHGSPGFCPTEEGVTVVIDFRALGGTTIVRCAKGPVVPGFTGHSALLDAGIQIQGTRRYGEAFICRIENRPGPNEVIPIKGQDNYKEPCLNTPPASGYWSYWWATNGGQWQYSQWGVKNRNAIRGGFEGWAFSLNATASTNPKPRITPRRPGSAPQPTTNIPTQGPTGSNPNEQQNPGGSANPGADDEGLPSDIITTVSGQPNPNQPSGGTTQSTQPSSGPSQPAQSAPTGQTTLPPGLPREGTTPAPSTNNSTNEGDVQWTGGEPLASGNNGGNAPSGVPVSTMLTGFAVLILIGAAVITAQYRRSKRS
ncbi:hypothetical protein OG474_43415 [Kribbella sp. NBC_01505]|uniref:hypothetical protein n=1 Tax=Kribbella sp. NBC_01505 TaxID=2903580 RepID=UPI003863782D